MQYLKQKNGNDNDNDNNKRSPTYYSAVQAVKKKNHDLTLTCQKLISHFSYKFGLGTLKLQKADRTIEHHKISVNDTKKKVKKNWN